ncbi:flavin-containing monooxygenase FMO GS-OX-like 8 [Panicum miliaceum]|uniref:Flavin-containing monooxygenase FMO GS-OX-like 8 n=1 Tax=Panicum miliaceum TaxID=4540 RepID=A0A3L6RJM6_PANMI|nr:flavin-containing monooxygenase FMO GS-OX-like 8 [Panicum miliaceum]
MAKHAKHTNLHPQVARLCANGQVAFANGSIVATDAVVYCTRYTYSRLPCRGTRESATVEDNRVGPLFKHTFPPALALSLSFIGVPMPVFVSWFLEAQARWITQAALPPEEDMLRAVRGDYHAREMVGLPARYSHDIGLFKSSETRAFVGKYADLPDMEDWKMELFLTAFGNMNDYHATVQDYDDYSENIREGFQRWLISARAQYQAAIAAAGLVVVVHAAQLPAPSHV